MKRSEMIIRSARKMACFCWLRDPFSAGQTLFLVGQSPFYICWWKKTTFIKQFMNEGRLRRILGHCTFSVSTSFCSKHLSKVRDYHICFYFILLPSYPTVFVIIVVYSDHAPIIIPTWFFCAATSSTSSSHFFAWTPNYWKRCRCDMSSAGLWRE